MEWCDWYSWLCTNSWCQSPLWDLPKYKCFHAVWHWVQTVVQRFCKQQTQFSWCSCSIHLWNTDPELMERRNQRSSERKQKLWHILAHTSTFTKDQTRKTGNAAGPFQRNRKQWSLCSNSSRNKRGKGSWDNIPHCLFIKSYRANCCHLPLHIWIRVGCWKLRFRYNLKSIWHCCEAWHQQVACHSYQQYINHSNRWRSPWPKQLLCWVQMDESWEWWNIKEKTTAKQKRACKGEQKEKEKRIIEKGLENCMMLSSVSTTKCKKNLSPDKAFNSKNSLTCLSRCKSLL